MRVLRQKILIKTAVPARDFFCRTSISSVPQLIRSQLSICCYSSKKSTESKQTIDIKGLSHQPFASKHKSFNLKMKNKGNNKQMQMQMQNTQKPYVSSIKRKLAKEAAKEAVKASVWRDDLYLADFAANEERTMHKQLIVLDLNGTLVHRLQKVGDTRKVVARPGLGEFLNFALENFAVMVWSSAQPASVVSMLKSGFGAHAQHLVRVWDRRFCDMEGKYFSKTKTIKDLSRITDGFDLSQSPNCNVYGTYDGYLGVYPAKQGHWKLEDIVLIDDSESKATLQKENHIFISTFAGQECDFELSFLQSYLQAYVDQKDAFPHLLDYVKTNPWLEYHKKAIGNSDEIEFDLNDEMNALLL